MKTLKHTCTNCESTYKITWNPETVEDDPRFCPVCSEYILDEDSEEDDDVDF